MLDRVIRFFHRQVLFYFAKPLLVWTEVRQSGFVGNVWKIHSIPPTWLRTLQFAIWYESRKKWNHTSTYWAMSTRGMICANISDYIFTSCLQNIKKKNQVQNTIVVNTTLRFNSDLARQFWRIKRKDTSLCTPKILLVSPKYRLHASKTTVALNSKKHAALHGYGCLCLGRNLGVQPWCPTDGLRQGPYLFLATAIIGTAFV